MLVAASNVISRTPFCPLLTGMPIQNATLSSWTMRGFPTSTVTTSHQCQGTAKASQHGRCPPSGHH